MMRLFSLVAMLVFSGMAAAAPQSGSMTWNDWSFSWTVGPNSEGLEISNVRWKGVKVLHKGSLPVIRVKYDGGDPCGPYANRINWGNIIANVDCPDKICIRNFGSDLMDIVAMAKIGGYYISQVWYFTKSGQMGAHMWSRGWHCNVSHRHHAHWRLDFDVESTPNQIWHYRQPGGPVQWFQIRNEEETGLAGVPGPGWWIEHTSGAHHIQVVPFAGMEVGDAFSPPNAAYRLYRGTEDVGWPWGATSQIPFNEGEQIWGTDNVFWWVGHLSHRWDGTDPGGTSWHATSVAVFAQW